MLNIPRHWDNGIYAIDMEIIGKGYIIKLSLKNTDVVLKEYATNYDDGALGVFDCLWGVYNYYGDKPLLDFKLKDNMSKSDYESITMIKE